MITFVFSSNVRLIDTENGARIKAFAGPNVGSGIVNNITFEHFTETSVDSPLVIDQVSQQLDSKGNHVLNVL